MTTRSPTRPRVRPDEDARAPYPVEESSPGALQLLQGPLHVCICSHGSERCEPVDQHVISTLSCGGERPGLPIHVCPHPLVLDGRFRTRLQQSGDHVGTPKLGSDVQRRITDTVLRVHVGVCSHQRCHDRSVCEAHGNVQRRVAR
eukprot:7377542-Prymnesium_polylepis.2